MGGARTVVLRMTKNGAAHQQRRRAKVLILDEAGMIDGLLFEALDAFDHEVHGRHTRPVGGIQLVLSGNFLQPLAGVARSVWFPCDSLNCVPPCANLATVHSSICSIGSVLGGLPRGGSGTCWKSVASRRRRCPRMASPFLTLYSIIITLHPFYITIKQRRTKQLTTKGGFGLNKSQG